MNLRWPIVFTLFRTELRMLLRDRRVLVTSLLLPMLVTPLLMLGSKASVQRREKTLREMTFRYAVTGPEAAAVRELVNATRARIEAAAKTNETMLSAKAPLPAEGNRAGTNEKTFSAKASLPAAEVGTKTKPNRFRFEEAKSADPTNALATGNIHFILSGTLASPTNLSASAGVRTLRDDDGEKAVPGELSIQVIFRGDRDDSGSGSSRMGDALRETRRLGRVDLLKQHGFPIKPADAGPVSSKDLASKRQVAGLLLGRTLTLVLMIFVLTGGAVVAIDSIAGEKERGTLETLLTTAATRMEILAAKHLGVVAIALLITLLQSGNLLLYFVFKLLPLPANLSAAVTPGTVLLLFFLYLPVLALVASVLLLLSGYAKSYKEAQMYFMPALLVALLPAVVPMLPGVSLRSIVLVLPVANIAVAAKEILIGNYDWPMIALAWMVTAGASVLATRTTARFLLTERLITATDRDAVQATGGLPLFERHVWAWFALLWGVLLMVNGYTDRFDIRLQLFINLIVLFFGAVCLMLRRYKLNPREALALRAPRPMVWLGVLFAVPGGFITALGVFQLANYILPVPQSMTESFGESVFPKNIPFWQILACMTILPGIFEELTFRGMLLHGLHRRLRPGLAVLVVGVVFGIYHVALFRFIPTAALGAMFAVVTLLTGSIYPAMLWHACNNALGVLAFKYQIPETGLEPITYVAGVGMLAAAFYIFWRNRSVYPGIRRRNADAPTPQEVESVNQLPAPG